MQVRVLGSHGWFSSRGLTSCVMVVHDGGLLLLDAGTGVAALGAREELSRFDHIDILLTHYHLDHVAGLAYLSAFCRDRSVTIYGPGEPLYAGGVLEALSRLLEPPLTDGGVAGLARSVELVDVSPGEVEISGLALELADQAHGVGCLRVRAPGKFVYATDTRPLASVAEAARDGETVLHDCWDVRERPDSAHSSVRGLLATFPEDVLRRTVLIHSNPLWGASEREAARCLLAPYGVRFATDGMAVPVGGSW